MFARTDMTNYWRQHTGLRAKKQRASAYAQGYGGQGRRLRQAEGFFAVGGDAGEGPGRIEDDFDIGFADAGEFEELALDLGRDLGRQRTTRRGERHFHVDARVGSAFDGLMTDVVNEAEVDDVARDFRVVALLELREELFVCDGHTYDVVVYESSVNSLSLSWIAVCRLGDYDFVRKA